MWAVASYTVFSGHGEEDIFIREPNTTCTSRTGCEWSQCGPRGGNDYLHEELVQLLGAISVTCRVSGGHARVGVGEQGGEAQVRLTPH